MEIGTLGVWQQLQILEVWNCGNGSQSRGSCLLMAEHILIVFAERQGKPTILLIVL